MAKQRMTVMMKKQKTNKQKKKTSRGPTPIGTALRGLGSLGGGALGGYLGNPLLGSAAGSQLGALASKWLGFGDYAVSSNSVISKASTSIPSMHRDDQSVIVSHKEYVGVITSSTNFAVQYELPLNPGMAATFPWLANIASRFSEYAFRGVVFHYVPSSGTAVAGTNPALGSVMIQTSYRASDGAPSDKAEMLNEYCASQGVPSETFIHPIECNPKENPFNVHYVRNTAPPSSEPLMSYDLGRTFVATTGQLTTGSVLGDLWVTYEVELKKPVIRSAVVSEAFSMYKFTGTIPNLGQLFAGTKESLGPDLFTFSASTIVVPARTAKQVLIAFHLPGSAMSTFHKVNNPTLINATLQNVGIGADIYTSTVTIGESNIISVLLVNISDPTLPASINLFNTYSGTGTLGDSVLLTVSAIN